MRARRWGARSGTSSSASSGAHLLHALVFLFAVLALAVRLILDGLAVAVAGAAAAAILARARTARLPPRLRAFALGSVRLGGAGFRVSTGVGGLRRFRRFGPGGGRRLGGSLSTASPEATWASIRLRRGGLLGLNLGLGFRLDGLLAGAGRASAAPRGSGLRLGFSHGLPRRGSPPAHRPRRHPRRSDVGDVGLAGQRLRVERLDLGVLILVLVVLLVGEGE